MYHETAKISAIIIKEHDLEVIISQLIADSVARSDISIQGSANQIKDKYGVEVVNPQIIQDSHTPPTQAPFLDDDFGWVVGFSFALPLVICLILGIFVIGDVRSDSDVIFNGIIGAVIGLGLGALAATVIKKRHKKKLLEQEKQGGFVLWVITHSKEQTKEVIHILKSHSLRYRKH